MKRAGRAEFENGCRCRFWHQNHEKTIDGICCRYQMSFAGAVLYSMIERLLGLFVDWMAMCLLSGRGTHPWSHDLFTRLVDTWHLDNIDDIDISSIHISCQVSSSK